MSKLKNMSPLRIYGLVLVLVGIVGSAYASTDPNAIITAISGIFAAVGIIISLHAKKQESKIELVAPD